MTFKIKDEVTVVNNAPVDSVGGAKPEPEMRSVEHHQLVEEIVSARAPIANPSQSIIPKNVTLVEAQPVGDAAATFGQQCALCKHFNREVGSGAMRDIRQHSAAGDALATNFLRQLSIHIIGEHGSVLQPEVFGSPNEVSVVDQYLNELGACAAYTEDMNDLHFVHPAESCPSEDERLGMACARAGWMPPKPDASPDELAAHPPPPARFERHFEAKSTGFDKHLQKMRDDLLFTAKDANKS